MNLYAGTSGYSYPKWKGSFYPEKLPAKQMLSFYATQFPTVEINNTFYRMPSQALLEGWLGEVSGDFRFVIKAPQRITHIARLKETAETVRVLYSLIATLGARLGPVLYQLPPFMKKDLERLKHFLGELPVGKATFEFRHPSWFDEDVFGALRDHNAALCLADADNFTVPTQRTSDWGYARLRRTEYDDAALDSWASKLLELGWSDAYVFFKHEDEGTGPKYAKRFIALAAQKGAVAPPANPAAP